MLTLREGNNPPLVDQCPAYFRWPVFSRPSLAGFERPPGLSQAAAGPFLEVQVVREPAQAAVANSRAIEIHLAEGRRILVEPGFDAKHLRAVVAALETRG